MGNTEAAYAPLEQDTFEDVNIDKNRNFDCIMVFDMGSADKDWHAPADGSKIQYEYLKLLDSEDIERRKELFPQHGADFTSSQTKEKHFYKNERKLVIRALTKLDIKCSHITAMTKEFESDKNLKFYYIGIPEATARKFADKIEYELQLDPQCAVSYLQLLNEPLANATVSDDPECQHVLESQWKNIYIKFNNNVAPEIYKPFDVLDKEDQKEGYEDSLFSIRDRLALINEIVTQDVELGGCGIYVRQLAKKDHCIVDFYPLHTTEHLEHILSKLFSFSALTYNILTLPLEEIRAYFGEYIGIYFAYLEFMTYFFLPLSVGGLILQSMQWAEGIVLCEGIQYFALLVILCSVCFPIMWRRREFNLAQKWGTLRFDLNERPRPDFEGVYRMSNVNGGYEEHFPHYVRNSRRFVTLAVVITFLIALFGSVFAVILLRVYVAESDVEYGTYFISVANAFVIMFFNNIYGIFAEKLNEWENYKTETEYENNLIIKIFIFRFINSYATLYYICFVRRYESDESLYCSAEDCMEDLAAQLGTIFITQLTVSNATELGSLAVARCFKGVVTSFFTENEKDSIWAQYSSEIYERTFDDYCEILVAYGYATLFVIAFPLAPLAAFIGCIVEARIDGYKLCKLTRRPFPRQADDVGTWQIAMEVMGWAVLVTNLSIVCFTAGDLDFEFLGLSDTWFEETLTALILFALLAIVVFLLTLCIASKPFTIDIHMQRQDHIEKSVHDIGTNIARYLDSLKYDDLKEWQRWSDKKVTNFLRFVLYKNADAFRPLAQAIARTRFDGRMLARADEHLLEKKLGVDDHLHKRFILNARRVLEEQLVRVEKQDALFEMPTDSFIEHGGATGAARGRDDQREIFEFKPSHLLEMASFFAEDLTGQSKRKLWDKVDKDLSTIIEYDEMENFLYFSIVVFIKAKHQNVRLPKKSDKKFKNRTLKPLEEWLRSKVPGGGLTFEDFDSLFPSWLREYYRVKDDEMHGRSSVAMGGTSGKDARVKSNISTRSKLGNLLGSSGVGSFLAGKGSGGGTGADMPSGSPVAAGTFSTEQKSGIDEDRVYDFASVNRSAWTQESVDWEKKLESVASAIDKTDIVTRQKIWDKFDRKKIERLDCDKSLSRLIYSLIALYIKTRNRESKPPKYSSLQPLLGSICDDIKVMINSNSRDPENTYITKHDFQTHIAVYLKKIAQSRKHKRKS